MASSLFYFKSETRFSPHGCLVRSVLLGLIVLFLQKPSLAQNQPQLISFKPLGNLQGSNDGIFLLDPGASHSLLMFTFDTTNTTNVKWTQSSTTCDESQSLYGTVDITSISQGKGDIVRAEYTVSFPLISDERILYFCLRNEGDNYVHQGNESWLTLRLKPASSSLLPLPVTIMFIIVLMCLSGLFSGLNLGLMALDPVTLKIIIKSGSKLQKKYAKLIYRVRRHGNYLLCTLLLGNVLVNSTFTILLDSVIGSGLYAVIGATLAIVIFGEIVPQAICSRYGLLIGAYTIPLTYVFMVITFPLSFPLSLILNLILGKEIGSVYNRQQLLELLNVTQEDADINDYELGILHGALKFKEKKVNEIMTPFEHVFCININAVLDFQTIKTIYDSGFSRIPIYEEDRNNIVGILHLRDLTFIDPEDCTPVKQLKDFYDREPNFEWPETTLDQMLQNFVEERYHMAIIRCVVENDKKDNDYKILGIITLEDIIEEIIGREIVDEYDQFEDNVTRKKHERKNMVDIGNVMYTTPMICLSAPQMLAVKQFLASAVEPFQNISKTILHRLLQQDIVFKIAHEKEFCLYKLGVPANYFTLLLEGCLLVTIGEEGMEFEARGFYSFGAKALSHVDPPTDTIPPSYIPDFTVRPGADCLVLIVTRQRYIAAYKASRFEEEHGLGNSTPRGDVFSKEWKAAEKIDLQASLTGGAGLTNITHLLKTKPLQEMTVHSQSKDADSSGYTTGTSSEVSPVEIHALDVRGSNDHLRTRLKMESQV